MNKSSKAFVGMDVRMSSGPRTVLGYLIPAALMRRRIEFFLIDTEAEVLDGKRAIVVYEVEGQSVVNVYGRERSGNGFRPAHIKEVREALGRNALDSRGYDGPR